MNVDVGNLTEEILMIWAHMSNVKLFCKSGVLQVMSIVTKLCSAMQIDYLQIVFAYSSHLTQKCIALDNYYMLYPQSNMVMFERITAHK